MENLAATPTNTPRTRSTTDFGMRDIKIGMNSPEYKSSIQREFSVRVQTSSFISKKTKHKIAKT